MFVARNRRKVSRRTVMQSERSLAVYAFIRPMLEIISEKSLSRQRQREESPLAVTFPHVRTLNATRDRMTNVDSIDQPRSSDFYTRVGRIIGHLLSVLPSNSARGRSVKVVHRASFVRAACGTLVQYEIVTYVREHANYPRSATANFLLFPQRGRGGLFLSLSQSLAKERLLLIYVKIVG